MEINSRPELHDAIRVVADALVASPAAMAVFGASLVEIARTGEGLDSDDILFDFFDALGVEV